ncbi:MAG TPA: DUF4920 domain-containing protein [Ferruginibacter sp.]|nr:DUF4920 domain-containing protein [Ferruginibacter sp.]
MKKIFVCITALFFAFNLMAQPPKGDAKKGTTYGEKVAADGAITASELSATLIGNEPKEVKIMGEVTEVCKMEGCWIRMKTDKGTMLIKMKDHAFLVPLALNGKTVVVNGVATYKETSVEMLRHYAEDAGKSKEEIAAITEPKKEITMQAKGILVL